uniref:WD repeat-containing protein 6 n=2 Tax=Kalanchoe fedtschenkoi TaxID=63787 RepID=A0A7N0UV80_KALFE
MGKVQHGRLRSGRYLGEISALCFLHLPPQISSLPYLLVGMGSEIILYNLGTGREIGLFHVFEGIRVHGVSCTSVNGSEPELQPSVYTFMIAVYGEKKVKLFKLGIQAMLGLEDGADSHVDLVMYQSISKFRNWVLDVCFLKASSGCLDENKYNLAIGCSDNSVFIWDTVTSSVIFEVESPDRCLLYSMRLWGDGLKDLHIASGTIFNEIIVWKVENGLASLDCSVIEGTNKINQPEKDHLRVEARHICKLSGHEGSIFRITWSVDGSKLVSVSDDRCARFWCLPDEKRSSVNEVGAHDRVLYGHTARVWDCCISESLIVTAGEDCTCRVWNSNGVQLQMIKEHIGRGIWRCLYDPTSSLLITAGFDSSIRIRQLNASSFQDRGLQSESQNQSAAYSLCIPKSPGLSGHMNSKSEYVRCLRFTTEGTLYVATNNGFLFKANISELGDPKWTELARVSTKAPIICLDVMSSSSSETNCGIEDWIAVGDGRGTVSIVRVIGDVSSPEVDLPFMWPAEPERQLLGTFWSKSLGNRYIFTSDPKGTLKLWKLNADSSEISDDVYLVAEFLSSFGTRIICLDASFQAQVVVCGDLRGNLILFRLSKDLLSSSSVETQSRVPPLNYFKGVHGISSVACVSVSCLSSNQSEIRSSGADGCICYLQYDAVLNNLEFVGLKQVKELSLIQYVSPDDLGSGAHAVGFASGNFIIWNLMTDTKIADVPCGGWRRPYSYFLGDVPELAHCFAYVKDETIYVHKYWVPLNQRMTIPNSLHIQFHGREIHSLCFITENSSCHSNATTNVGARSSYIASGSEDGTVRLSRYTSSAWSGSKSLGEHVGGSAVRSICPVSEVYRIELDETGFQPERVMPPTVLPDADHPFLLISVGAKRVLTTWLLRKRRDQNKKEELSSSADPDSMTFQWLSSDMPARIAKPQSKNLMNGHDVGLRKEYDNSGSVKKKAELDANSVSADEEDFKSNANNSYENDFRYMAVTAFLVKGSKSRSTVCFVIVACSDGSLSMRALILPQRFWFDVTEFVPVSSPVLALQHIVTPSSGGGRYILISGSTNGNITFWDLTNSVYSFMMWMSMIQIEKSIEGQKRPRTGRGSQGGRWWKSVAKKKPEDGTHASRAENGTYSPTSNNEDPVTSSKTADDVVVESKADKEAVSFQIRQVQPMHVVNQAHQSGVNCLHVSKFKNPQSSDSRYVVLSGGDDQALHSLVLDVELGSASLDCGSREDEWCRIRCVRQDKIASAHSSAVKGVWSDGKRAFSTGLDQRVRCWQINELGNLCEQGHLVINVPEPETLDARGYERDRYEIAVGGRGMQLMLLEASASPMTTGKE